MSRIWNALVVMAVSTVAFCAGGAGPDRAVIEAAAKTRLSEMDGTPGAVVGVRVGDAEPVILALGSIDKEATAPMTVDRPMRIASATKPFLGNLVLLLADEQKLSLDDPISKYVDGVPQGEKITLRMLGNNTSGVFNSIADKDFREAIAAVPGKEWTAQEILAYAFKQPPAAEPGAKWSYSNTNAVLLGEVVKKVTGRTWQEELAVRVLKPLKLLHTGVGEPSASEHGAGFAFPNAYRYARAGAPVNYGDQWIDATAFSSSWAGAAGSMYSTVGDLVIAAEPLATGELLSQRGKGELHKWVNTGHTSSASPHSKAEPIYYGFCIGKRALDDRAWMGHTGDVPGYSSFVVYEPTSRTTVVVLANLSNTRYRLTPAEEIGEAIIAAIRGEAK